MRARPSTLVFGCGHRSTPWILGGCPFHHPAKDFVTVDINQEQEPDILADITKTDALKAQLPDLYQNIILEHLPSSTLHNLAQFKECLSDNGYLIIINSGIQFLDSISPSKIWLCPNNSNLFGSVIVIIPKNGKHIKTLPQLNEALTTYLMRPTGCKNKTELLDKLETLYINDENRNFFHFASLRLLQNNQDKGTAILHQSYYYLLRYLLSRHTKLAPTTSEIMSIIGTYSPGLFRKVFTDGYSEDMKKLLELISGRRNHLYDSSLHMIAEIISKRKVEALFTTETTRVYSQIYARIIAYFEHQHFETKQHHQDCGFKNT